MIKSYCDFCGKEVKDLHKIGTHMPGLEKAPMSSPTKDICNECLDLMKNKQVEIMKTIDDMSSTLAKEYKEFVKSITKV